jgi:hypothetical protein
MAAWNETQAQPDFAQIALAQHEQGRMYLHSRQRAVVLPFWQAVASGGFVGVFLGTLVGVLTYVSGAAVWWKAAGIGLVVAFFAFLLAALVAWFFFVNEWRAMVWQTENFLHRDIDGDGYQGQPQYMEAETVKVTVVNDDGTEGAWGELPVKASKMREFAKGVMAGREISRREWTQGHRKLFSQGDYDKLIKYMADPVRGWLVLKDRGVPTMGYKPSVDGVSIIRTFASETIDPPTLAR